MKRTIWVVLFVITLGAAGGCGPKREVNILSMGDIAQVGPGQARVAAALERHVRASGKTYDGLFTAGDNFYMKLTGVDDPKWRTLFEEMYNPAVLSFPFYVALGNHDYDKIEGGEFSFKWQIEMAYARENPQSRWKLPNKWYRVDLPAGDGEEPLVTVLVFDSYKTALGEAAWAEQLAWMRRELERPRNGKWLVAVAHHPLYSNGSHGDNGVMQREIGPLFREHGVDLYICGHDHDLQHLEMPDARTSFLLVGGGGASTRPMRVDARGPFSRALQGFADLNFTPDRVTVRYIGVDGSVVHAFDRTRSGKVKVLETTGTDRAVPRSVKDVTRPDAATRSATTHSATTRSAATRAAEAVTRPTTAPTRP
jgi:tartrate-resistant acid phosphatase type 5